MQSFPGPLSFGRLFFLWLFLRWTCQFCRGVSLINCTLEFTSGCTGPGFGEKCFWNVSANSSTFSDVGYIGPFTPFNGWFAGRFFRRFLFSLNIELSAGFSEFTNLSHSCSLCVLSISLINLILWLSRRLITGSRLRCHLRRSWFLVSISCSISVSRYVIIRTVYFSEFTVINYIIVAIW